MATTGSKQNPKRALKIHNKEPSGSYNGPKGAMKLPGRSITKSTPMQTANMKSAMKLG